MSHCASTLTILVAGLALTAFTPLADATSLYHAHRGHITGHSSYHSSYNVRLKKRLFETGAAVRTRVWLCHLRRRSIRL